MKKIYLAGPMRGYPEFNFPAFHAAATALRAQGCFVWSPAEHDEQTGIDVTGTDGTESLEEQGFDLRQALAADLRWIALNADAVAVLAGWQDSLGANAEVALARALGLEVIEL